MAIQYVSVRCPNCDAELEIESTRETAFCTCCGTRIIVHAPNQTNDASYYTFPGEQSKKPKKSKAGKVCLFLFLALMLYSCVNFYGESLTGKSKKQKESYEDIYNEYAQKLKDATPKLISEYYAESKKNTGGIMGLATISNSKIFELAEISNEGVMKMANLMYATGGDYSEYEEWSTKLYSVYMEESGKITSAYMSSSMGAFGY